jgi:hypothetical protein
MAYGTRWRRNINQQSEEKGDDEGKDHETGTSNHPHDQKTQDEKE